MTAKSPVLAPNRHELSIFHLDYRAARGRRRRYRHWLRVPYGGLFALGETMSRALAKGRILDYRLTATTAITPEIRASLTRWPEALASDGLEWDA